MKRPFISIILPVYNVEQYLQSCLDSIKNQTFKDFEIIIINDASPDKSQLIINEFISSNPDINVKTIIHKENRGISASRNSGLDLAQGNYVYFIDSDDDILPDCLTQLSQVAKNKDSDIIVGENLIISGDCEKVVEVTTEQHFLRGNDVLHSFCKKQWYNQVWNKLYKLSFLKENHLKFLEGVILEDELWSFQVATYAKSISFVKGILYNYYIRPKSIISSVKNTTSRWNAFGIINSELNKFIIANHLDRDPIVAKYFLDNILVNINGYSRQKALNRDVFLSLKKLNLISISKLKSCNLITYSQWIAYSYFDFPDYISYEIFKLLSELQTLKKLSSR